jgi:ATP-dependent helicase HrpB
VLAAFSDRLARRLDSGTLRCELVHGRRGLLARESVAQKSDLFVAAEIHEIEGRDKTVNTLLSLATAIEENWLREMFPEDIEPTTTVFFDATARRVYADEHVNFRGLSIGKRRVEPPPLEPAARLLAGEVVAGRLRLEHWDHSVEQWILRVNLLARNCPELEIPPLTEAGQAEVIAELCHGAFTYKEIRDKPVKPVVLGWLSHSQREMVDKHAPERLALANGRSPKVAYDAANPPHIALRIQELYGVTATPRIAMGRLPVLVHILAPSMRPVQITQDLAGFWSEHYPRIKQELQRKYPRHVWK